MHKLWFSLALLFASAHCFGQSADPCKSQNNTLEIDECGKLTLKAKDKELNQAYQALLKSLKPDNKGDDTNFAEVKKRLLEAQRAWITFRDNDCKAKLTLWASGTIRGAMYLGCLTERTEQRTKELRNWANE